MDDDEIKDPLDDEEVETDTDDVLIPGKKKPKIKDDDTVSLDDLGEEEEETLPEDNFDDVDLW